MLVEGVERTPTPPEARSRCKLCGSTDCGCVLGRPPEALSPSGITDEQAEAATRQWLIAEFGAEASTAPTQPWSGALRLALAAALELQGGERTHTLVPNDTLARLALDLDHAATSIFPKYPVFLFSFNLRLIVFVFFRHLFL